ncbi:MAG: tetratricopeptide repeat protein [Burkholderiales bacterium]|nr:tetratricopeptide repeat protein [Bacteroidia bacterium]
MNCIRFILLIVLCLNNVDGFCSVEQDSSVLIKKLNQAISTQQKINANIALAKFYLSRSLTRASTYVNVAKTIAQKSNNNEALADAYTLEGEINYSLANYDLAKSNYAEALLLFNKEKQQLSIGEAYSGLGKIAYKQDEFDASITHYSEALKIFEKYNYKDGLAAIYINLALLYEDTQNNPQAAEYYNKALNIAKENNDIVAEASCYTNLGNIYCDEEKYELAIEYLETSLKLKRQIGNRKGEGSSLNNLGATYYAMHNEEKALQYFLEAYQIYMDINDIKSSFPSCNNIGAIYYERKEYDKALHYYSKAYNLAEQLGSISKRILCLESLTLLYRDMGDFKKAVDYSVKCWGLKDTLYNKDQAEITTEMQTKFASEKKQKENEILNLKVKSESFIKTIFIIAAGVLGILVFFVFRGLKQKQRVNLALEEKNKIIEEQKKTVENQKHIVEEQNKDITDSIRYAERIQSAILPPDKQWQSLLPQSFVFYKPKDILSGDFYWIEQKGDLVFVAAADCTGHGVPGALISIVNYNLLNKAVLEKDLNDPADILNYVNNQLIVALHQTYQESSVKDGMDISLCVLNTKTLEMNYAGANNPIYIISNNKLTQINADKFPVGAFIEEQIQTFNTKNIQLHKNDLLYLFSDGYADQFGGDKGKKFKYKQLKDILEEINLLPMPEQAKILENSFIEWKGALEQVDDVLVIGIRV